MIYCSCQSILAQYRVYTHTYSHLSHVSGRYMLVYVIQHWRVEPESAHLSQLAANIFKLKHINNTSTKSLLNVSHQNVMSELTLVYYKIVIKITQPK